MAWQKGPLPADTYNWGGVVLADFCGDHVMLCPDGRKIKSDQVQLYDNGLELPTKQKAGARLE